MCYPESARRLLVSGLITVILFPASASATPTVESISTFAGRDCMAASFDVVDDAGVLQGWLSLRAMDAGAAIPASGIAAGRVTAAVVIFEKPLQITEGALDGSIKAGVGARLRVDWGTGTVAEIELTAGAPLAPPAGTKTTQLMEGDPDGGRRVWTSAAVLSEPTLATATGRIGPHSLVPLRSAVNPVLMSSHCSVTTLVTSDDGRFPTGGGRQDIFWVRDCIVGTAEDDCVGSMNHP